MWSGVEGHLAPNRDVVGKLLGLEEVNFSGEMPQCGVSRGVWRKEAGPKCGGRGCYAGGE